MSGVAIVGIGIHPFGRHEGVSGRAAGRRTPPARRSADAGIGWDDVQFAFGGSRDGGDADTLVNELGLTGLPFINVWNGCATGGSALDDGRLDDPLRRRPTSASRSASTSTPAGPSTPTPRRWASAAGTARPA